MSEEHELLSDSDEDDEDYVPDGAENEPISEAESEGVAESGPEDENDENNKESGKGRGKKRSKAVKSKVKKRKKKAEESKSDREDDEAAIVEKQLTEEEEKKKADSLWADFMKDAAVVPKLTAENASNGSREKLPPIVRHKTEEKIKITKVFKFAGEEVKIEKEVTADSAEARLSVPSTENTKSELKSLESAGKGRGVRRTGLGGISSVLGQLGKKAKISTLEKSKLDWDNFKKQENLEEEINTHNRGKGGYLERQDFLQRADLRQFEIEKQLRSTSRRSAR